MQIEAAVSNQRTYRAFRAQHIELHRIAGVVRYLRRALVVGINFYLRANVRVQSIGGVWKLLGDRDRVGFRIQSVIGFE